MTQRLERLVEADLRKQAARKFAERRLERLLEKHGRKLAAAQAVEAQREATLFDRFVDAAKKGRPEL
jgi:hypothetical protein